MLKRNNVFMLLLATLFIRVSSFDAAESEKATAEAPKWEHFAFVGGLDYLDGPRLEALGASQGRKMGNDVDGNWFILWKYSTSWLRSIRVDGRIETIVGNDHWGVNLNINEGPAAFFPNFHDYSIAGDQSNLVIGLAVYGSPMKGEDYGSIYVYNMYGFSYKIFKNKEKDDRWWFKRLGTIGEKASLPTTIGETALISEVVMKNVRVGHGWMTWQGHLYKFDEAKQTVTCLVTPEFYIPKIRAAIAKIGSTIKLKARGVERMVLADDGTMYLMHPWRQGNVFRISADLSEFEFIVQHNLTVKASNIDGPGLGSTWHCGPSYLQATEGVLFLRAIDSPATRRWENGRVSVLCFDGEWREHVSREDKRNLESPSGMGYRAAEYGLPYIYVHYVGSGRDAGVRAFRFGPVSFTKPTIGPLVGNEGAK